MTDPADELLAEFSDITRAAHVARPETSRKRQPVLVTALAVVLVFAVAASVLFVVFGTRPSQLPVAAASPSASPSSAEATGNPPPDIAAVFSVENRGGPSLVIQVNGSDVATAGCGEVAALAAGRQGVPALPWDVTIVRADDRTVMGSGDISKLPAWYVQIGNAGLGPGYVPIAGPPGPVCAPTGPTPSPESTTTPPIEGGFPNWAPDGQHMIVDGPVNTGKQIRDASGAYIAGLPDSYDADWVDSSTIESRTLDGREITLYDVAGHEISVIPGEYESALSAPGKRILALTEYARHGLAQGSRYKIWNDGSLSDWSDGHPVSWSPDGTRLVVLHPTDLPALGLAGTLDIVDVSGGQVQSLADWTSSTTDRYSFSPDGRYLAACLADPTGADDALRVVDTQAESVTKVADGPCGYYLQWSPESKLYVADAINRVIVWTPAGGVADSGLPEQTIVSVAPDGTLATWTDGDSTVHVHLDGQTLQYGFANGIEGISWSPSSRTFGVSSNGSLSLITLGVTQPSAFPTPSPSPTPSPTAPPDQATSDDGTNWSVVSFDPLMTVTIGSVSSIDGSFLAVGTYCDNSKENCLLKSADGLSWSRVDVDGMPNGPGELPQVIHAHGLWVAGSAFDGYHGAGLWTSPDGSSWVWAGQADVFSPPDCTSATDAKANIYELYATDSAIVAEGQYECGGKPGSKQTWQSSDGTTWEPVDAAYQMFEISKSNGVYLGQDQNGAIRRSSDGLTWGAPIDISQRTDIVDNFDVTSIANGFIGVTTTSPGMAPHRVITSPDGQTWTDQTNPLGKAGTEAPSSDGSSAVMIEDDSGSSGAVWVSRPDGTQWTRYELPSAPGARAASVAIVGNTIVVVGDTGDGSSVLWVTEVSKPQ